MDYCQAFLDLSIIVPLGGADTSADAVHFPDPAGALCWSRDPTPHAWRADNWRSLRQRLPSPLHITRSPVIEVCRDRVKCMHRVHDRHFGGYPGKSTGALLDNAG